MTAAAHVQRIDALTEDQAKAALYYMLGCYAELLAHALNYVEDHAGEPCRPLAGRRA